jgi:hypothetical protein
MKGKLTKLRNEKKSNKINKIAQTFNKDLKLKNKPNYNPLNTDTQNKNIQLKSPNQNVNIPRTNYQNLYAEDTEYEIESVSKYIQDSQTNKNSKQPTYIEQLETKIQEQAKRLNDLYKYKILCEKRIKDLNPNEEFPVSEESIKNQSKKSSVKDENENKYDELLEKHIKLKKNYNELKEINSEQTDRSNKSNVSIEKYKLLKEKYKQLKNENDKIINLLQQETNATEEQKNIISMLQQTIDSELLKNGTINQYITPENLIDFIKLKNEADEYRKELVLSQAMVNSLKYEIEQFNKEKEDSDKKRKKSIESYDIENNNNPNNRLNTFDDYNNFENNMKFRSNSQNRFNLDNLRKNIHSLDFSEEGSNTDNNVNDIYSQNENNSNRNYLNENISLKNTINKQNQTISDLLKSNSELKQLVNEAVYKLNEGLSLNNNARDKMKNLELEIELKKTELGQYEEKFTYFNDYISNVKSLISNLQNNLNNYVEIFNKMANEDLNSLLTKSFSDNILVLKNKISKIQPIQKYNLEYDKESKIIQGVIDALTIINNEFVNIYEKVFESKGFCKESNQKLEELQKEINSRDLNLENQKENIECMNKQLNNKIKENLKIKEDYDSLVNNNSRLSFENNKLIKDIDSLNNYINKNLDLLYIICKISQITDGKLNKILKEAININETIIKLKDEKNQALKQSNICNYPPNTLNQIINEFDRKINENEIHLDELKRDLNLLFNMYNSYGNRDLRNSPNIPSEQNILISEHNIHKHQITNSSDFSNKRTKADTNLLSNTDLNTYQNTNSNQIRNYENFTNSNNSNNNLNYKYGNKNEDFQKFIETNSNLTNSLSNNSELPENIRKKVTYQVMNTSPH